MNEIFKYFYMNKKVLITGHTGFKGSWLSLWLLELGAEVIGYSLEPPTQPSLFDVLDLKSKLNHIIGDIRDSEKLDKVFQDYKPEIVFHLASQPLVRVSYSDPKYTYETNVIGTVNVLESVRSSKSVKACIVITTDKCYENKEWIYGYRENDSLGGYDPYSSSKACVELVVNAYRRSFFNLKDYGKEHNTSLASCRAGNVIGGGDWAKDRILPDCIRFLSEGKPIVIRNPKAIRPWQFILEPLSGYLWLGNLLLTDAENYSAAWNFGPFDESIITVEELTGRVIKIWGKGKYIIDDSNHPHEAKFLKLDISRAISLLKWKPLYNIDQAIENTVIWYKNYYNGSNELYDLTVKQIESYVNLARQTGLGWCKNNNTNF